MTTETSTQRAPAVYVSTNGGWVATFCDYGYRIANNLSLSNFDPDVKAMERNRCNKIGCACTSNPDVAPFKPVADPREFSEYLDYLRQANRNRDAHRANDSARDESARMDALVKTEEQSVASIRLLLEHSEIRLQSARESATAAHDRAMIAMKAAQAAYSAP